MINSRTKLLFVDRDEPGPAQRSFTYDEATYVALMLETMVQRSTESTRIFRVDDALHLLAKLAPKPLPAARRYLRPMLHFLQLQVNAGLLVEVTPTVRIGGRAPDVQREFTASNTMTHEEWARTSAAAALGLPYAAHVFSDITVRVHRDGRDDASIGSGVVIAQDWILTNAHVVRGAAKCCVSWGASSLIEAIEVIPSSRLDLAVLRVPGFEPQPFPWMRQPCPSEPVVILTYPEIPQVASRPLLRFNGWVATEETITTYFGEQQIIVSAVMGPGASGGPIFGADGCLVGLVVHTLEGKKLDDGGSVLQSTFHAALPGNLILDEIRSLDVRLENLNTWVSSH
jgi:S1-C subfamily serine protease